MRVQLRIIGARLVVWRNAATVNPWCPDAAGHRRPHPRRRPEPLQIVDDSLGGDIVTLGQTGSPVSAHHTDNDFGADTVASNPATARTTFPEASVRSTSG